MVFKNRIIEHLFFQLLLLAAINMSSFGQRQLFSLEFFKEIYPLTKINKLHQDTNGLIWLGTSAGLFSFDGINYQLLPETEARDISHICTGADNELLVGTENGDLLEINFKTGYVNLISTDSINHKITGIVKKDNLLFVSSYGSGLWLLRNKIWQRIVGISDYTLSEIYAMEMDEEDRILLGTDYGLCIINDLNKKCEFLSIENGLPDNIVKVVELDNAGNVWLGFHQQGFCMLDKNLVIQNIARYSWYHKAVTAINIYGTNQVFVGTEEGTIVEYDYTAGKMKELMKSANKKTMISDILIDREANIWISDHQNGLRKSSLFLSFLDLPNFINSKNVQALFMDSQEHLWFNTEEALYECTLKEGNNPVFKKHLDADVYGSSFISLYVKNDAVWVGTFGMGLLYYLPQSGKVHAFKEKHGLANNNVLSIAATEEKIWFATLGGVSEASIADFNMEGTDHIAFKNFHEEDGLGTEYIYQVIIDSHGNPWFATDGKGLTTHKDGRFTNYSEKDGLDSKVIYSVTEDEYNNIWLATPKKGVYHYDGKVFENYGANFGFENKQISSLHTIKNSLAVIHKFGIDLLRQEELRSFGASEGIGEINPDLNAVTEDPLGNLWIGYQNGIIKLNTNLKMNLQPEIVIDQILVNLNPMDGSGNQFTYDENYLTFNYLGLWYSDPLKIKYEYKLNGINKDWVSSRDNFVSFPNLPSGQYTFTVRASANGNFEAAKTASYQFEILEPYWKKLWFFIILFSFVILLIALIIYIRDKTLKKRALIEQEKIQFQFETLKSQINPHFLFNSFNTLISVIEEEPKLATEYVEKLSDFFRNILQLREKDVISLREEIVLTMDYAFLQEKRFGQNFSLLVNIPDRWLETEIPPLTLQLLAENAIKHNIISNDKPLTLRINIDQDYIIVQNNIHLKMKAEVSTKIGLENIVKRYQLISDLPVEVIQDEINFTIRLPLIV